MSSEEVLTDDIILTALEDSDALDFSSDDGKVDKTYAPGKSTASEDKEGDLDQDGDVFTELSANQNLGLLCTELSFLLALKVHYIDDCLEIGKPPKDTHDLLSFRLALAEALVAIPKINNVEWGSEFETEEAETAQQLKRYLPSDQPCPEKRLDSFNHWPEEVDLKSRTHQMRCVFMFQQKK